MRRPARLSPASCCTGSTARLPGWSSRERGANGESAQPMHQAECRAMPRRLTIGAALLSLLAFPAGAIAAKAPPAKSPQAEKGAPAAKVKIRVGHLHGG